MTVLCWRTILLLVTVHIQYYCWPVVTKYAFFPVILNKSRCTCNENTLDGNGISASKWSSHDCSRCFTCLRTSFWNQLRRKACTKLGQFPSVRTSSLYWSHTVTFGSFFVPETPPSIFRVTRTPYNFKDGGSVTLHCHASGDSPITYQWFAFDFNGNSKDISGSRYNHQSSIGRLTISNLQHAQDDGYFYCVAMNAAGKTRSDRVLIQVSCKLSTNKHVFFLSFKWKRKTVWFQTVNAPKEGFLVCTSHPSGNSNLAPSFSFVEMHIVYCHMHMWSNKILLTAISTCKIVVASCCLTPCYIYLFMTFFSHAPVNFRLLASFPRCRFSQLSCRWFEALHGTV